MSTLADMLRDPSAYRGACGDLCAGALRLTPQEVTDLTLQVAGQTPARARQLVAQFLIKPPSGQDETASSKAAVSETPPTPKPQPPAPPQPVAHVQHLPPAPQLDLPAKPPTPKFEGDQAWRNCLPKRW